MKPSFMSRVDVVGMAVSPSDARSLFRVADLPVATGDTVDLSFLSVTRGSTLSFISGSDHSMPPSAVGMVKDPTGREDRGKTW
jgi:hypothetical protein